MTDSDVVRLVSQWSAIQGFFESRFSMFALNASRAPFCMSESFKVPWCTACEKFRVMISMNSIEVSLWYVAYIQIVFQ